MNLVDLSIIIVSYNTKEITRQCVDSIIGAEITVSYEIIVVDNGSDDGTTEMIESSYKKVILIKNRKNLFFSKAINQGIAIARGLYIMLLNSDTIFKKRLAETLIEFLVRNHKVAAVGPKILNPDNTLQSKGGPLLSIFSTVMILLGIGKNIIPQKIEQTLFPTLCWDENHTTKVGWIAGCCMMIRREALTATGGFGEEFIFYGEEIEWCYRANGSGWEIWYVPQANVVHLGGSSTSAEILTMLKDKEVQLRNYAILMKNTVGLGKGTFISFLTIILKYIRFLVALLTNKEKKVCNNLMSQAQWETIVFKYLFLEWKNTRLSKS